MSHFTLIPLDNYKNNETPVADTAGVFAVYCAFYACLFSHLADPAGQVLAVYCAFSAGSLPIVYTFKSAHFKKNSLKIEKTYQPPKLLTTAPLITSPISS